MFALFVSELNLYLTKDVQQELFVDTSRGQKLRINMDVTFAKVGCTCKFDIISYSYFVFMIIAAMAVSNNIYGTS